MFMGTAFSVRLLVYAGLSLFIINGPYLYMLVCVPYAYNLTWGGLKNGKNGGEPNGFCLIFVAIEKMGNLRKVAPLSLNCFGRFSVLIPPYLFTVHVRPVLSPCQASNTCYISSCFSNTCTIDNILNTICTHNVYMSCYLLLSRVVIKLNLWTHR